MLFYNIHLAKKIWLAQIWAHFLLSQPKWKKKFGWFMYEDLIYQFSEYVTFRFFTDLALASTMKTSSPA